MCGTSIRQGRNRCCFGSRQFAVSCQKNSSFQTVGPPTAKVIEYAAFVRPKNFAASS